MWFRLDVSSPVKMPRVSRYGTLIAIKNLSENALRKGCITIRRKAQDLGPMPLNWEFRDHGTPPTPAYDLYYYHVEDVSGFEEISRTIELDVWRRTPGGSYVIGVSAGAYLDKELKKWLTTDWINLTFKIRAGRLHDDRREKAVSPESNRSVRDLLPKNVHEQWTYRGLIDLTRAEARESKGYEAGLIGWYQNSTRSPMNVMVAIRRFDKDENAQLFYRERLERVWWSNHRTQSDMTLVKLNGHLAIVFRDKDILTYSWTAGRTILTITSQPSREKNALMFINLLDSE